VSATARFGTGEFWASTVILIAHTAIGAGQVLARLRYREPGILELFGGRQSMIESPLIQELEAEFTQKAMHESILLVLEGRFGPFPEDVRAAVQRVSDESALRAMTVLAARCPDIDAFRSGLPSAVAGSR
jgi:hypothetical protein